jgi:hypothetical protein
LAKFPAFLPATREFGTSGDRELIRSNAPTVTNGHARKTRIGAALTNIPFAPTPLSSGLAPVLTPLIARCSLADQRAADRVGR